ncbi:Hypothetical_protein [Hexamita inflata]|uniref:Hypothetical_protein n=1 Tax=Hexamita inflata TaxID=28002 RepID=A0AA86Q7W2_9EUKA|nr:Hypothetical protein HINF_LOCUS38468 [Hexamita inflata]
MSAFYQTRATLLEVCQPCIDTIQTQYCYIKIDQMCEVNKGETSVEICDQNGTNVVYKGQFYSLKQGIEYIIPRSYNKLTTQIQLKFAHFVTGIWIPDFDLEKLRSSQLVSQPNQPRNKFGMYEILHTGESRMSSQNKYEIINRLGVLKENNIISTRPRIKQVPAKIYIKVTSIQSNSKEVRVTIVNDAYPESNRLSSGDYYALQLDTEYCLSSRLQLDEEYTLIFNESVSLEWIPDFPVEFDQSSGVNIVRRGYYYPRNQYQFDSVPCCQYVEVAGKHTIRMLEVPLRTEDYNKPDFKPLTFIKKHELLVITLLYGDFGFTTYNGIEGWVCIRYVTKLGKEGSCACEYCLPKYLKKSAFELYQPKQPLTKSQAINNQIQIQIQRQKSQAINTQIQRQVFLQYVYCECKHCVQVKSSQEICVNPELVARFYQKEGKCIKFDQMTQILNQQFQEQFEPKQVQKIFLEQILPKTKIQIPADMMEELHKFSLCIYKDQLQIIRDAVVQNMNVLMKDYDTTQVKERLKNWITYNKPNSQRLSEEEIKTNVRVIVTKFSIQPEQIQEQEQVADFDDFNSGE